MCQGIFKVLWEFIIQEIRQLFKYNAARTVIRVTKEKKRKGFLKSKPQVSKWKLSEVIPGRMRNRGEQGAILLGQRAQGLQVGNG